MIYICLLENVAALLMTLMSRPKSQSGYVFLTVRKYMQWGIEKQNEQVATVTPTVAWAVLESATPPLQVFVCYGLVLC